MNAPLVSLLALLIGLATGGLLMWLFYRSRIAAAMEQGRGESASVIASSNERLRLQTVEQTRLQALVESLQSEVERWRRELNEAGNERAQLNERASRVLPLEAKVIELEQANAEANRQAADVREASGRLQAELRGEREAHAATQAQFREERTLREVAETTVARLSNEVTQLSTQQTTEREQFGEKLAFMDEAKRALTDQFKSLANDILEEKGKRFAEQNQTSLGTLLDPLKVRLTEFQNKVDNVYVNETKDRTALAEQVKQLMGLNQSLGQDAKNLTAALKGSNKQQGNWGEIVLERVLEASGLRKGHEYQAQANHVLEEGGNQRPDIIISLPEERSLVVDSKMSLNAFEAYATAEDDVSRKTALERHLQSVRTHIKGLSGKNYQTLHQLKSLDFVLMFIPIEPAFMLAVDNDKELLMEAWKKNVLLVSPSTLLFVVRTVEHLWRQEAQSKNAQDIARRGAELYDRLCGFTEELEKVGQRLDQAQTSFQSARTKLSGKQGAIQKAEQLRQLGVKPTKSLPRSLVESDANDDAEPTDTQALITFSSAA
jgi:DNA recombination protein RmuC